MDYDEARDYAEELAEAELEAVDGDRLEEEYARQEAQEDL